MNYLNISLAILASMLLAVTAASGQTTQVTHHWADNNAIALVDFEPGLLTEATTKSGGFKLSFNYDRNSWATVDLFQLVSASNILVFSVRFNGEELMVKRYTKYQTCDSWSSGTDGACTTWSDPYYAISSYSTFDDSFANTTSGKLTITLSDNGLLITNESLDTSTNGSKKTDFSYEGVHLTGIVDALLMQSGNAEFALQSKDMTGVTMTDINLTLGEMDYAKKLTIVDESTGTNADFSSVSPRTNFYTTQSGTGLRQANASETEEVITEKNQFVIYPNPASNTLYLNMELESDTEVNFTLLDLEGKQIGTFRQRMSSLSQTMDIPVNNYRPGLYLYTLEIEGKQPKTGKVIISNH